MELALGLHLCVHHLNGPNSKGDNEDGPLEQRVEGVGPVGGLSVVLGFLDGGH